MALWTNETTASKGEHANLPITSGQQTCVVQTVMTLPFSNSESSLDKPVNHSLQSTRQQTRAIQGLRISALTFDSKTPLRKSQGCLFLGTSAPDSMPADKNFPNSCEQWAEDPLPRTLLHHVVGRFLLGLRSSHPTAETGAGKRR